jgi:hypothetical protein
MPLPDNANLILCIMLAICGSAPILNAVFVSLIPGPIIRSKLLLRALPWIAIITSGILYIYGLFAFKSIAFFLCGLSIAFFTTIFMLLFQAMGEKVRDGESPIP